MPQTKLNRTALGRANTLRMEAAIEAMDRRSVPHAPDVWSPIAELTATVADESAYAMALARGYLGDQIRHSLKLVA